MDSPSQNQAENQQQGQVHESPPSVNVDDALSTPSAHASPEATVFTDQQPPAVNSQSPTVVSDCPPGLEQQKNVDDSVTQEQLPPSSLHAEISQSAVDDAAGTTAVALESEKQADVPVQSTEVAIKSGEPILASQTNDPATDAENNPTPLASISFDASPTTSSADVGSSAEVSLKYDSEPTSAAIVTNINPISSSEQDQLERGGIVGFPTQGNTVDVEETQVLPVQAPDRKKITIDHIATSKSSDEFAWVGVPSDDVKSVSERRLSEDEGPSPLQSEQPPVINLPPSSPVDQGPVVSEEIVFPAQKIANSDLSGRIEALAADKSEEDSRVRQAVDEAPLVAATKPSPTQAWTEQNLPISGDSAWTIAERPPAPQQSNSLVEEMLNDASNEAAVNEPSNINVASGEATIENRVSVDEESVVAGERATVNLAVDLSSLELEDDKQTKESKPTVVRAATPPHQNVPDVLPSALVDSQSLNVAVAVTAGEIEHQILNVSETEVSAAVGRDDEAPPDVLPETVAAETTTIAATPDKQLDSTADFSVAAGVVVSSGKQSPTDNQKTKESSASPSAGRSSGVLGFFQRKPKPSDTGSTNNTPDIDRRKKSGSLDRKVVGEDIIRHPQSEPVSVVSTADNGHSATAAVGFHLKFGIGANKDKPEMGASQSDGNQPEENTVNGSATPPKKPLRPSSAAADTRSPASVKSPTSKTNLRIFEIMASSPNGSGSKTSTEINGEGDSSRLKSNVAAAETSVFCPVGPPTVSPLTVNLDDQFETAGDRMGHSPHATGGIAGVKMRHPVGSSPPVNIASTKYMVTVAIDFGTAFSGYAFCFTSEMTSERGPSIHMMGKWEGADPGLVNQKTPSTLLLTADGQFHSFGFTARNFYHDFNAEDADQWLYFDKFKMALYNSPECSTNTMVEAANGQKLPVLTVVAMTLRFFRDHAIKELAEQCGTMISNDDIRWIVTVPAIWNSQAKQFMRLAAYEAGLATPGNSDQLLIALEPEAASIHIRRLRMHQLVPEKPIKRPLSVRQPDVNETQADLQRVSSKFNHRSIRYMVVDCGGGTVDITVHELDTITGRLQELHKAAGGPHGSCGIDAEFSKLLDKIFGAEMVQSFRHKRPSGWVDLMTAFETRKRAADPTKTNSLNVALPFCFIDYYRKYSRGSTVEVAINKFADKEIRWSSQGMLRMTQEAMKKLFQPTLDSISKVIASVLDHPSLSDVQFIFLVGGLSESPVVQRHMRDRFSSRDIQVLVPQEASLAVLKGAVCFGLDQTVVSVRRSRMTYGAAVLKRFIRGQHPESKLLRRTGTEWCRDIFDPYVIVDQVVHYGEVVTRRYAPASPSQTYISIAIFCSDQVSPKFTTDAGVSRCATLRLDLPSLKLQPEMTSKSQSSSLRVIEARMTFAETEIKVTAVDIATGQSVNASIDFFNV